MFNEKYANCIKGLNQSLLLLLEMNEVVLWINSPDYLEQYYLGPGYEKLWGRPVGEVFIEKEKWRQGIAERDYKSVLQCFHHQKRFPESTYVKYYQVIKPNGDSTFVADTCMPIVKNEVVTAIMGMVRVISEAKYQQNKYREVNRFTDCPPDKQKELFKLLNSELCFESNQDKLAKKQNWIKQIKMTNNYGIQISITKSEMHCLYYLYHGYSAQQTANAMYLSRRTVEGHLEKVRHKTICNSKFDLLRMMQDQEFLSNM